MKQFELRDGKNCYGFLDMETGYDYHEKRVIPGTQSYIRQDSGVSIPGCICKNLYDLEKISMLYVSVEPGVRTPASDYISHRDCEEITLVLEGKGTLELPDGMSYELGTDISFYLAEGQPHRIVNNSTQVLKYVVVYSKTLKNVTRDAFKAGDVCDSNAGCIVKNINDGIQKSAPGFTGNRPDDGHLTSIIFEGNNICFLHPIQKAGVSSPAEDFVSHPGVDELEFALSGRGTVIMPDFGIALRPGIMRYNAPEQPSKTFNNYDEDLRLAVFYSTGKLKNVFRTHKHARVFDVLNEE